MKQNSDDSKPATAADSKRSSNSDSKRTSSSDSKHDAKLDSRPHSNFETPSASSSTRSVGWALLITSFALAALVVFIGFDQRYWFLPPEQKLISSWKSDLNLIKNSKQAELLKRVKETRLRANDHSPAAEWVEKIRAPLEQNKNGDLLADVFLIHQIQGHRYGVVVQYEFIESSTKNKVGEFARTLWLGVYY